MITEKEVEQAIEECLREPVTGNKRAVLADLIIIQDYLFGEPIRAQEVPQPMPMQSYSAPPMEQVETYIETNGDSEFLKAVDGQESRQGLEADGRTCGGGQDTSPENVHDFHRQGTRPIKIGRWELSHRPFR